MTIVLQVPHSNLRSADQKLVFYSNYSNVTKLVGEQVALYFYVNEKWENSGCLLETDNVGKVSIPINDSRISYYYENYICKPNRCIPFKYQVSVDNSFGIGFIWCVIPEISNSIKTKGAIFSIDGSFAGSRSLSGNDPKVRPGSVDLVRFWKDRKQVLCIYITARPAIQKENVENWLARHNFPHGPILFTNESNQIKMESFKNAKLNLLSEIRKNIDIVACYGSDKDKDIYLKMKDLNTKIIGIHTKNSNSVDVNNNSVKNLSSINSIDAYGTLNGSGNSYSESSSNEILKTPRLSSQSGIYPKSQNEPIGGDQANLGSSTGNYATWTGNSARNTGRRPSHSYFSANFQSSDLHKKVVYINNGYTNHILELEHLVIHDNGVNNLLTQTSSKSDISSASNSMNMNMRLLMSPFNFASFWKKQEIEMSKRSKL